ncbi:exopolyphosphatase [Ophiostoma piceae UAMH 11346]|uniref:Exopolyphosphatase n=1 Tax=Ophiostoma piceae (strain UAMH 11346) TaxID=1262450 RepID=S3CJG5_OPHP1|nr:exopolyphosphatase [Ophiostoma piceae UAMH 11346]
MPPRSLAAFLKAARAALNTPAARRPSPLTIVVGNESADLDSLCSAVLAAYFRSHTPQHNAADTLHIPLSNLRREDLKLRPELAAALSSTSSSKQTSDAPGISLDSLITLSDLPEDLTAADTRWLLVDHNALTGELARRFSSSVIGCIDHHVDEGSVPLPDASKGFGPRVIEKAGSCASLVINEFSASTAMAADTADMTALKYIWSRLAAEEPDVETDRTLARLTLAPILIDTSNLKSPSKTVDIDRQSTSLAEAVLGVTAGGNAPLFPYDKDPEYERTVFFEELSRLKDDISKLSYNDILRKDYKQWHEEPSTATSGQTPLALGMSTVVQGFDYLLNEIGDNETLFEELRAFAKHRDLDIAAIMTVQTDKKAGFGRQLLIWAFNERATRAMRIFVGTNTERLQLAPWGDGKLDKGIATEPNEWRACWTQGSLEYSRKQLAPYLREAMRSS